MRARSRAPRSSVRPCLCERDDDYDCVVDRPSSNNTRRDFNVCLSVCLLCLDCLTGFFSTMKEGRRRREEEEDHLIRSVGRPSLFFLAREIESSPNQPGQDTDDDDQEIHKCSSGKYVQLSPSCMQSSSLLAPKSEAFLAFQGSVDRSVGRSVGRSLTCYLDAQTD